MDEKIHARVIIEMMGAPKEHIEKTMKILLEKLQSDEEVTLVGHETADATQKEKYWSLFTEAEVSVKNIPDLIGFCFDYMPSSVEILSPSKFTFNSHDFAGIINDMQTRLHQIDMVLKGVNAENQVLKKNGTLLLTNIITLLLKQGTKDSDELARGAGIPKEQLKDFLDFLVKNKKITETNGKYSLL
mgnify:CR=1 FL=1